MGWVDGATAEPKESASPKGYTEPSIPTSQYPPPSGVWAAPPTSHASDRPSDPAPVASPCACTAPSPVTIAYPAPSHEGSRPTTSAWTGEACRMPPSPTHSQCQGSGHVLPPGCAHPGWFQPNRPACSVRNA